MIRCQFPDFTKPGSTGFDHAVNTSIPVVREALIGFLALLEQRRSRSFPHDCPHRELPRDQVSYGVAHMRT
jgi:hypothetical protein